MSLLVNGLAIQVKSPLNIEDLVLEATQRTESGGLRLARTGDTVRALKLPIQTEILTTAEKDLVEVELLKVTAASVSADYLGSAVSCYLRPQSLQPGPLDDQWTWFFEIEEIG